MLSTIKIGDVGKCNQINTAYLYMLVAYLCHIEGIVIEQIKDLYRLTIIEKKQASGYST